MYICFLVTILLESEVLKNEELLTACFYRYLQSHFNVKGFVIEDDIEKRVFIYRFVFDDNMKEFNTYYTIDSGKIIKVENKK